jgi:hypothetical protein
MSLARWAAWLALVVAAAAYIDVNVMLALDTVTTDGRLANEEMLTKQLATLAAGGVDGVMVDVWWGIAEPAARSYNFDGSSLCLSISLSAWLIAAQRTSSSPTLSAALA